MTDKLQPITDKLKAAKALITENFQHAFAFYIITGAGIFLYRVAFTPNDQLNELSGTITGFITGTVVATVVNYLYGTSKSSQDKNKLLASPQGEDK